MIQKEGRRILKLGELYEPLNWIKVGFQAGTMVEWLVPAPTPRASQNVSSISINLLQSLKTCGTSSSTDVSMHYIIHSLA